MIVQKYGFEFSWEIIYLRLPEPKKVVFTWKIYVWMPVFYKAVASSSAQNPNQFKPNLHLTCVLGQKMSPRNCFKIFWKSTTNLVLKTDQFVCNILPKRKLQTIFNKFVSKKYLRFGIRTIPQICAFHSLFICFM